MRRANFSPCRGARDSSLLQNIAITWDDVGPHGLVCANLDGFRTLEAFCYKHTNFKDRRELTSYATSIAVKYDIL